jgi:hypothetical protein
MKPPNELANFIDVTDIAKAAGCDFGVWFSRSLVEWCQIAPRGPGLWTREGGLLCSLAYLAEVEHFPSGPTRLKTTGERISVELSWFVGTEGMRRVFISLADEKGDLLSPRPLPLIEEPKNGCANNRRQVPFYFVCLVCEAKWFAETQRSTCPRCRTSRLSNEQLTPPWWKRDVAQHSLRPNASNRNGHAKRI